MTKFTSWWKHAALLAGVLLVIVAVAMVAKPTLAAKNTGVSSITLNPTPLVSGGPALGSTVSFTTNAAGLAGWEWPMVGISCTQSGTLVYTVLDKPDASFVLGGGSSTWTQVGGSADCVATLYAYGHKAGRETIRSLAATSFAAVGS
jgi:hypothetical protein